VVFSGGSRRIVDNSKLEHQKRCSALLFDKGNKTALPEKVDFAQAQRRYSSVTPLSGAIGKRRTALGLYTA
jgi:hypothetical protein